MPLYKTVMLTTSGEAGRGLALRLTPQWALLLPPLTAAAKVVTGDREAVAVTRTSKIRVNLYLEHVDVLLW